MTPALSEEKVKVRLRYCTCQETFLRETEQHRIAEDPGVDLEVQLSGEQTSMRTRATGSSISSIGQYTSDPLILISDPHLAHNNAQCIGCRWRFDQTTASPFREALSWSAECALRWTD